MSLQQNYFSISLSVFSFFFLSLPLSKTLQAQILPDQTLGSESSVINSVNELRDRIEGGAIRGENLFHSFQEFSISNGSEVYFANPKGIINIFSRVTGNNISEIFGTLGVEGNANLFFINPNGIVFGENAVIDVGGSFIATTANEIEFADGNTFAVTTNDSNVTISVTLPVGVNFNGGNGTITVNGAGNQIISNSTLSPIEFGQPPSAGISLKEDQNLILIGNEINLNGGVITSEGGSIYLTSVESGSISINQSENKITLLDNDVIKYQNINLNQQSLIDTSGEKVGTILATGKNINLSNGSFLLARNQGERSGGSINIKASESLNLFGIATGNNVGSGIRSEGFNTGEGSDVNIQANQLLLQNEARIRTNSFNEGAGGNVNLTILDLVELSSSSIGSGSFDKGNAGNITVVASGLQMSNVGSITSSTIGSGDGGEINIQAELIDIVGSSTRSRSNISASTFSTGDNPGNAGNININTKVLNIRDSGSLSSSAFGNGNSNSITINASELIEISGINQNFQGSNNRESTIRTAVQAASPSAQKAFGLPAVPTGDAGNLTINTPLLNVTQQGVITVENQGTGGAGTLTINADNLNLDQFASITAAAESGLGGNIELNTTNLNISNDSQISSAANGNELGGNITINTQNLNVKKNNEITASAFEGDGGNIIIDADSVSLNSNDEITARSELGDGGNIKITSTRLQLDNSRISASAGGEGNGGNVTINTDVFTALDNTSVTARAVGGDGGNIEINTTVYFVSDDFVVSASSEFGLDGTVEINVNEQALQEIFILSDYPLISLQEILAKSCLTKQGRIANATRINSLGRGALPISPSTGIDLGEDIPMQKVHVYTERDWQPGEPLIQVEKFVTTAEGKRLGVAEVKIPQRCLQ